MQIGFSAEMAWRLTCSICGAQVGEMYPVSARCEVPYPSPPVGWRVLDGLLVCDRHMIVVDNRPKDSGGARVITARSTTTL